MSNDDKNLWTVFKPLCRNTPDGMVLIAGKTSIYFKASQTLKLKLHIHAVTDMY